VNAAANRLRGLLGVDLPLIGAPMAGGTSTPALAAAVSNAGGVGSLGCGYLTPEAIAAEVAATRALTEWPFAVNLFVLNGDPPTADPDAASLEAAVRAMAPFHEELGIEASSDVAVQPPSFSAQLDALLEVKPAAFSFTFGILAAADLARLREAEILTFGTATSVAEALALEAAGVDVIVAQGSEAGGHRGTFLGSFEEAMIGTLALVPQVVDAVRLPVIAAGGIMDGRGVAAALGLGAAGAQLGTALIPCPESGAPEAYKRAVLAAGNTATAVTSVFSGRPARGLINRFMRQYEAVPLPYPIQNALTGPMRRAAASQGKADFLSLWAGQGVGLSRALPAGELVKTLAREAGWL
jgi:nitronate monooxygenase